MARSGPRARHRALQCAVRGIGVALLLASTTVLAQTAAPPALPTDAPAVPAEVAPATGEVVPAAETILAADDPVGLAAFIDGLVTATLARDDIPGMIVAVVRDDAVLLARGYGLARVDPPRAADADGTLFRLGSVSKTFTYTAAMQLVEQGRIGLDDPVNQHLPPPLQVPDQGFGQPLRVRHLLTHSAGFEDPALGHLFHDEAAEVESLDQYLVRWRPQRVRAPDTHAVYSNYGVALLGALVAHVTGTRFESYIEQHVTGPLGMAHTTFREPLPAGDARAMDPALAAQVATGYDRRAGAFVAGPFEHIAQIAPAGSASSTAADMARWMRVHLGEGELDGVRILAADTARGMRELLFGNAEGASGIAHGFLTQRIAGEFAYGHGGATLYFHTAMHLFPAQQLGVFVSANGSNARLPVRDVARLIARQLLPEPPPAPTVALGPGQLARYAGRYFSNRRPYESVEKLLRAAGGIAEVTAADDGTLRVASGERVVRYLPTGRDSFRAAESGQRLVFLTGADGQVSGFVADPGIAVMQKLAALQDPRTLVLALLVAALVSLLRLVGTLRRRRYSGQPPRPGRGGVKALVLLDALAWLAFLGVGAAALVEMLGQGNRILFTYPSQLLLATLALATAAAVLTTLELLALPRVWTGAWKAWPKLRHTLAVVVLLATLALMWQWNLVGMQV